LGLPNNGLSLVFSSLLLLWRNLPYRCHSNWTDKEGWKKAARRFGSRLILRSARTMSLKKSGEHWLKNLSNW
jgi:hypothetical protein